MVFEKIRVLMESCSGEALLFQLRFYLMKAGCYDLCLIGFQDTRYLITRSTSRITQDGSQKRYCHPHF